MHRIYFFRAAGETKTVLHKTGDEKMTTTDAKKIAYRELNRKFRVLAPESEAVVQFPEYDPCRAVMPIAIIKWPCIVNCRETVARCVINPD